MKKLIYMTFLGFTIFGCSTAKFYEKFQNQQIVFGSGGGFSGKTRDFVLETNGKLSRINNDTLQLIQTLDSSATRKLFKKIAKFKLAENDFQHPGNVTKYIGIRSPKQFNNRAVWGEPKVVVPEKYIDLYNNLLKYTR